MSIKNFFLKKKNYVWVMLILFLGLLLVGYCYKGVFSRYLQDDYCYGARIRQDGFLKTQVLSYTQGAEYNGNRYSLTLFSGVAELLGGPSVMAFHAMFWIIFWVSTLTYLFCMINQVIWKSKEIIKSILYSEIILVFTFYLAPELFQVLFWRSGSLPYLPPIIFNTLLLARLIQLSQKNIRWYDYLGFGLIGFLSVGFSETDAVMQVTLWGIIVVYYLYIKNGKVYKDNLIKLMSVIIGVSIIGVFLLATSPANMSQLSIRPPKPITLPTFFSLSFHFGLDIITDSLKSKWLPFVVLFTFGFVLGILSTEKTATNKLWQKIVMLLVATYLICVACTTPSVFLGSVYPENRALFASTNVLVFATFTMGSIGAEFMKGKMIFKKKMPFIKILNLIIIAGLSVYMIRMIPSVYDDISPLKSRAMAWDKRQEWIYQEKDSGIVDIVVPAFDSIHHLPELQENWEDWINNCAADYYGVDKIIAQVNFNNVKPWFE